MELDDEVIQVGLSAEEQSAALLRQAISASTTHEKDKIIEELLQVWRLQEACSSQVNGCIASMQAELDNLTRKEDAATTLYDTLCRNAEFLDYYSTNPPTESDKQRKINAIREIEQDIARIGQLSAPDLLTKTSQSDDYGHLKLRDLEYKRLEELSYNLKKRSFIVDESEDLSLTISEEFGDLQGLVATHDRLLAENERLKSEEAQFLDDTIVKRRNLKGISSPLLVDLVVALQHELEMQQDVGDSFPVPPPDDDQGVEFEQFCNKTYNSRLEFSRKEFSTTINMENIEALLTAKDPCDQLNALTEIVSEQENTVDRLVEELEMLRKKVYADSETTDTMTQREQRLWQLHDKFQNQIHTLQDQITRTNNESSQIHSNILATIYQSRVLGQNFGDWLHKYKSLVNDEVYLMGLSAQNREIVSSLANISFGFGLRDMKIDEDMDTLFASYFKKESRAMTPIPIEEPKKVMPPEQGEEEDEKNQTRMAILQKQLRKKSMTFGGPRRARKSHLEKEQMGLSQSSDRESEKTYAPNPIANSSPVQLLDFLSLAYDIRSRIEPVETHFHADISGRLHFALGNMRSMFYKDLHNFEEAMRNAITKVSASSDIILRVPKIDVETEADTEPKVDGEGQTEEEENPKGKGKKPQPPKGKKTLSARGKSK